MTRIMPQLKSLHSPDVPKGEEPLDPTDCAVLIEAGIGPKGLEGEEIFTFVAITPRALAQRGLPCWGRGHLILASFSWAAVEAAVQNLLAHCSGETWSVVAGSLNRELHWEFDSYRA